MAQSTNAVSDTILISRLKLNTKESEYSPYVFQEKLYFVSNRPTQYGVVVWDQNFNVPSKIFEMQRKDSLRFFQARTEEKLNPTLNSGPLTIGKYGIYFTSTSKRLSKNLAAETPLRIFYAAFNADSTLQDPIELDFHISDSTTVCHPAIWKDSVLYFTYFEPKNTTGTDIYYSTKKTEEWSPPIKCNEPISTTANEEFPVIMNNKLFFSSNRSGGKGGLDFYSIDLLSSNKDAVPFEILNSEKDDFGIFLLNKKSGYFSSNRNGNDDIFYFAGKAKPNFDSCEMQLTNSYCYLFKEKDSFDNNDTINMFYEWNFGDGEKAKGMAVSHCFPGEGIYKIELNVIEKNSGETFLNELSYDLEVLNEKQLYIYSFDTVAVGQMNEFSAEYSNIENYNIENYYWNFGDKKTVEGLKQNYVFKKPGTYKVKLLSEGTLNESTTTFCTYKLIEVVEEKELNPARTKLKPMYYQPEHE